MAREVNRFFFFGAPSFPFPFPGLRYLQARKPPPTSLFFSQTSDSDSLPIDLPLATTYKESFSRRMAMAGLKPHHRIALGVSGGPDSVALCVLAAGWKTDAHLDHTNDGCINGLLAIVVDHGLRVESRDEAHSVCNRVSQMGIRCQIAHCDWPDGRPKQGHLQEMAREMRYKFFQKVCVENRIGVLLIAHHADDQAELFILRLSRNSGVLGLAGMAFTCQLFPMYSETPNNHGILLARPLIDFSKEDLYKICQGGKQEWVEDPTNQSPLFARNRIRISLKSLSSCIFKSEILAIISACRRTRSFVDKACSEFINRAVTITVHGYAIIDLKKLDPINIEDLCLSKFVAVVLQFISQRHRPVRGRTSKLLLDYTRNFPCKKSLTAAGCYLCPAPQSKGTKVLVCCCLDSPIPSEMEISRKYPCDGEKNSTASEIEQIIIDGKAYSDCLNPDASEVPFLHATSSESVLSEGRRLGIIGESTHESILLLQREETSHFNTRTELTPENEAANGRSVSTSPSEPLQSGQFYHFMNRFLVTWKLQRQFTNSGLLFEEIDFYQNSKGQKQGCLCRFSKVGDDMVPAVRHMIDTDWLYLARLSRGDTSVECQEHNICSDSNIDDRMQKSCSDYARLSAERALQTLKLIPLAARRGLPVLVNSQGLLLSIPSICFEHCPCLSVHVVFKPRVPLGGGHSSFI